MEFKVICIQPKFLTREEREKLKKELPKAEVKSSVSPVRSRSPKPVEMSCNQFQVPKRRELDIQKYRSTFRFEWDAADDTEQGLIMPRVEAFSLKSRQARRVETENKDDLSKKMKSLMTPRDWRIFKENHFIETFNNNVLPFRNWDEGEFDKRIKKALIRLRYYHPTPVQMQGIPVALTGQDMIGISYTGSGKSAAYLVPLINYCLELPRLNFETARDGPYALILSPTRELAQQLTEECTELTQFTELRTYCIVGGKNIETQRTEMTSGVEILIATPGRLLELLKSNYLVLNQCLRVIIDEADKIFLLELAETIREIFSVFPNELWKKPNFSNTDSQNKEKLITLQVFSATIDAQVEQFWRTYLRNPATVKISDFSRKIIQKFEFLDEGGKRGRIRNMLKEMDLPALVFVNQRQTADCLKNFLDDRWKVACLHGEKSQDVREGVMERFREGKLQVLITTDVFSRGINVKGLKVVVNFDCPKNIIDYEHRIGRTGRMGQKGTAVTFVTQEDSFILPQISNYLRKTSQKIPEELIRYLEERREVNEIIE
jgi:ATP-dependent RNA helicase DDX23/PRP28